MPRLSLTIFLPECAACRRERQAGWVRWRKEDPQSEPSSDHVTEGRRNQVSALKIHSRP